MIFFGGLKKALTPPTFATVRLGLRTVFKIFS